MTDLNAALRDEIHSVVNRLDCDADVITDEIFDRLLPLLDEGVTYDWGARCTETGHNYHGPSPMFFFSRAAAERYVNNPVLGGHELVRRRRFLGEWEAVSDA